MANKLVNFLFPIFEALGYHLTSNHYYEPIPDSKTLKKREWNGSKLAGVNLNMQQQLNLLEAFQQKYSGEYNLFPLEPNENLKPYDYYSNNGSFESVDGETLYCMIRHFKPQTVIEVGSGSSTLLSAKAITRNMQENRRYKCKLKVYDPYPNQTLQNGFPGLNSVTKQKIQEVSIETFRQLKQNDILFIDSSHVLAIGSDVQYEYLEVLPRLNKGVIVHSHDIFLPFDYPKDWVLKERIFWTEQYLLQAFLAFNDSFKVLWAGNYLHTHHPDKLSEAFNSYTQKIKSVWVGPGSFWMQKVK